MFVCFLIHLFFGEMAQLTYQESSISIHQERRFVSAEVGHTVTLQCFYEGEDAAWLYWYKQSLGQTPRLISTFFVYDTRITFQDGFNDKSRFTLNTKNKTNHLIILNLKVSDSATYYCASSFKFVLHFMEGTIVSVKDSGWNVPALVHQSASETIQPGGSVTLNCTVPTGTCDGEHSVYWFKNSEESHSGLIYTQGDRNSSCPRKPNQQSCDYNLPIKSIDHSHAGTYYCAVASCGHILFGNGTKLDFEVSADSFFWRGAVTLTSMLSALLAFTVCMMKKRNSSRSPESENCFSASSTTRAEGYREKLHLYYPAVNLTDRSRAQSDPTWSECVYHGLRS
ncbi:immunoglobulin kappa light chain-like isoform X2 [Labrus bergylta]|uniref:immunoglobulin kappa light chain-like isoform X2 n=1 Tax=Labrus bergylta TaxID=56723 RepID=UPI003313C9A7